MKTKVVTVFLATGLAAVAANVGACSGGGSGGSGSSSGSTEAGTEAGPAAPSAFAGKWNCQVNYTLTYTQPPNAPFTGTDSVVYVVTDDPDGTITVTTGSQNGADAGAPCPTKYTVSGQTATIAPGQSCHESDSTQDVTNTFSKGTITLTSSTAATIDLEWSFTGTQSSTGLDGGTQSIPVAGTGKDADNCVKE